MHVCLRNIAMGDNQESVTIGQTDGRRTDIQTPDKAIPMCCYALQATQKLRYAYYCVSNYQSNSWCCLRMTSLGGKGSKFKWYTILVATFLVQLELELPYKRKFSRESNFRYFREWFENAKICLREKLYLKRKFKSWYRHDILLHTLSNLKSGRKSRNHLV